MKRGTVIEMPMVPCHLSPEYFPEPEKFDPERFLKGNADNIIPFSYRPFGGELKRIQSHTRDVLLINYYSTYRII